MTGHVLIAGASGVIGQAAVAQFALRGFQVTALSRRRPAVAAVFDHRAVDLRDRQACAEALSTLPPVTHIVYAALYEEPDLVSGWRSAEQMNVNLSMLRHLVEPLLARGDRPHVSLFQGTKAYGVHIRPIAVPARESWPRHDHANFYWLQEDFLQARQAEGKLTLTIFRPQVVFGDAVGVAMNVVPVIGVYATLETAAGRPLRYPGGPAYLLEAVDAGLIAKALVWAAASPRAWGECFNITNGDVFVWQNVWPRIAEALGCEVGTPQRQILAAALPEQAEAWRRMAARLELAEAELPSLLGHSHHYADFVFATHAKRDPAPALVSTIKLRQAGFADCIDTEDMFRLQIEALQSRRLLPTPQQMKKLRTAAKETAA
ncbi:NAD-dependent epimerase/dehydratase family protein [Rhizobium sp. SSA_523]|uniref:NAD-dependent epimerase/dehydratase family protein n=1 Tax=Rhizobium sp. SSA_523 TaxID=2952477 RepID=UPI00208FFC04|nr:NAD-dependent epimerase/dehydratase family protein [Rhizobium sp. SSA_523]MCO5731643.1 NAD-dependent epimerase/dehydratase family protein [Rhizobium sp. SSA_523]WKC21851.1 NAD-dependent epimerase/dehydratase family protein [Rhizobium sp. SSA_523]